MDGYKELELGAYVEEWTEEEERKDNGGIRDRSLEDDGGKA
jgi:hypothetical protein